MISYWSRITLKLNSKSSRLSHIRPASHQITSFANNKHYETWWPNPSTEHSNHELAQKEAKAKTKQVIQISRARPCSTEWRRTSPPSSAITWLGMTKSEKWRRTFWFWGCRGQRWWPTRIGSGSSFILMTSSKSFFGTYWYQFVSWSPAY